MSIQLVPDIGYLTHGVGRRLVFSWPRHAADELAQDVGQALPQGRAALPELQEGGVEVRVTAAEAGEHVAAKQGDAALAVVAARVDGPGDVLEGRYPGPLDEAPAAVGAVDRWRLVVAHARPGVDAKL